MRKLGGSYPDIVALLAGGFSEETARSLYAQGEEVAIFVMLQLAALAMKPNAVSDGGTVDVNDIPPSESSGSVAIFSQADWSQVSSSAIRLSLASMKQMVHHLQNCYNTSFSIFTTTP